MASSIGKSSKRPKSEESKVSSPKSERSEKRETYHSPNVIEYKLSDQHFLDIGWTVKPSARIASKIIQYQTRLAKPHMNWFSLHRQTGTKYYDDLVTPFVAFSTNGSGRIFYPNGTLAITVNRPKKRTYDMYTVFTPGGRDLMGHHLVPQMLAVFDGLGNGIVLNEDNDTRLTYNQIGGIFLDNKVPYLWTWSLRRIESKIEEIDADVHSARLEKLLLLPATKSSQSSAGVKTPKSGKVPEKKEIAGPDAKIIGTEDTDGVDDFCDGENHAENPKRDILSSVKIICLRLNDYISLRIVDRHNISLKFFSRSRSIRIELGTVLNLEKPISSYSVNSSEGTRGTLRCRFAFENLGKSLGPDNSLYDVAREYRKTERIKRKRRKHSTSRTHFRS